MSSKRTGESQRSTWFLPDMPVSSPERDAFGHADVASNLEAMITTNRANRLLIGLFGPFGVGKSTVIELLKHDLQGNFRTLRISAERHEKPGFHRSFVFSFAEALQESQPGLKKKIEEQLELLHYSKSSSFVDFSSSPAARITRSVLATFAGRTARRAAIWFGAVLILGFGALLVAQLLGANLGSLLSTWLTGLLATAGVAGFLSLIGSLFGEALAGAGAKLVTPGQTTNTSPRVEAADEHERVFAKLVSLVEDPLVIAIDDIDRMQAGAVLEALNAIRSFQLTCRNNRPAFIVSVDEDVIAEAIRTSELATAIRDDASAVQAYLDRLFTQRQYMPPHVSGDLRAFAKEIIATENHVFIEKLGENLDPALQILIHNDVSDPRHVIRLLNAMSGDFRLAEHRENRAGRRSIKSGEVTLHPLVLARLTVLKVDFPAIYREISRNTSSLELIEKDALGSASEEQLETLAANIPGWGSEPVLSGRAFISRTNGAVEDVEDLLPFIYLGQDEIDRSVGNRRAREIRKLLADGLQPEFKSFLLALEDSADPLEGIGVLLADTIGGLMGLDLANAVGTLSGTLSEAPTKLRPSFADTLAIALPRVPSANLAVRGLLDALPLVSRDAYRRNLVSRIVEPFVADEERSEWFQPVIENRDALPLSGALKTQLDDGIRGELRRIENDGTSSDFELLMSGLLLPENSTFLDAGLAASLKAIVRSRDDLSTTGGDGLRRMIEASKPSFAAIESSLKSLVKANPTSIAAASAIAGASRLPLDDPKTLASFVVAYSDAVHSEKVPVMGLTESHLVSVAPLLRAGVMLASTYGTGKSPARKLIPDYVAEVVAMSVDQFVRIDGFTDELIDTLTANAPASLTPIVTEIISSWATHPQHSEENMVSVLTRLESAPSDLQLEMTTALSGGVISEDAEVQERSLRLLAATLNSSRTPSLVARVASDLAASMANRRFLEHRLNAAEMLVSSGQLTNASELELISAYTNQLLPYGGDARAAGLKGLVGTRWSESAMPTALAQAAQYATEISESDWSRLLINLPSLTPSALPAALVPGLEACALAASASGGSSANVSVNAIGFVSSVAAIQIALAQGKSALAALDRYVSDADPTAASEMIRVSWAVTGASELHRAIDVIQIIRKADLDGTWSAVEDQLRLQLFDHDSTLDADSWRPYFSTLSHGENEKVADLIASAWMGSVADVRASVPVASAALSVPTVDIALARHVEPALLRWIHEMPSESAARDLAIVASTGRASAEAASSILGKSKRGPQQPADAKQAFTAAKEAFSRRR